MGMDELGQPRTRKGRRALDRARRRRDDSYRPIDDDHPGHSVKLTLADGGGEIDLFVGRSKGARTVAEYRCKSCGHEWTENEDVVVGNSAVSTAGVEIHTERIFSSMCPRCGGMGMGINVYEASDNEHAIAGFAIDGPDGQAWIDSVLHELRSLQEGATFDEVLSVLGREPRAAFVREYLIANRGKLVDRGIALAGLAIALLSYLHVTADSPEPPTYDQIERIIEQLENEPDDRSPGSQEPRRGDRRDGDPGSAGKR
ncbi:hypothetical protein [uncultured Nocardioides sp.]|uniref:hypothetical protein n=1 Tax=uncultured Nocardioides sp. TaxID=198441 RepID=UPI002620CCC9|nr:hypothetical protein [uncultured Nocardioides sp.]